MPATYNGIGTHYYGRKNVEKRASTCRFCGRAVNLISYDTRLWFVVLFLPIVPLKKRRIIDQCPTCTGHFAIELHKWEAGRQLDISGAQDTYRTSPTAENAVAVHQSMMNYHQLTEAKEFRQVMRAKFPSHAKMHAYLGAALQHLGEYEEAAQAFRASYDLRPDLPEARVGLAELERRLGRLDEARRFLDFLEKPGAGQLYSLAPLEDLALAYQKGGFHEKALELFARLLEELPPIGQHTAFRKNMQRSERALRRPTQLPKRPFSFKRLFSDPTAPRRPGVQLTWRSLAAVGVVIAVILLLCVGRNEYVRRHRTLHLVNMLPSAALLKLDGDQKVNVGRGLSEVVMPEGLHHLVVTTGPDRPGKELDIEIRSSFFDRWFDDPIWVLNLEGAAVLLQRTVTYAENPPPASATFRFGSWFEFFPNVSHPFKVLPETLHLKSGESRTLTQLEIYRGPMAGVFAYLGRNDWRQAMLLAESQLPLKPDDVDLLYAYIATLYEHQELSRGEAFFRAGLSNRPVLVEWHRAYQSLAKDPGRKQELLMEYAKLLESDPGNSDLLYLAARITDNRADALALFAKAAAADPKNPYPNYALGFDRAGRGDWSEARPHYQKAFELRPNNPEFRGAYFQVRFALGEYQALAEEAREGLRKSPASLDLEIQLCDALVAAGRSPEAEMAVRTFANQATRFRGGADWVRFAQRHYQYLTGDFAGMERDARRDGSAGGRGALFEALIEQGKVAAALESRTGGLDPQAAGFAETALVVSIAWQAQGNAEEAATWRAKAVDALLKGDASTAQAARMLSNPQPPTPNEFESLALTTVTRALVTAALAQRHPEVRQELKEQVRRLNVSRAFPYHLLQKVVSTP